MTMARILKEYQPLKITLTRINGQWNIKASSSHITRSYISETFPGERELLLVLEGIEKNSY